MNKSEIKSKEEIEERAEVLTRINEIFRLRLPLVPIAIVFFIAMYLFLKPFETFAIISVTVMVMSVYALPVFYLMKRIAHSINPNTFELIVAILFTIELVVGFALFYFLKPIITYYIGGGTIFIFALVLSLWILSTEPTLKNRAYIYLALFMSCSLLVSFGILDYIGIYPVYSNYPVEHLYPTGQIMALALSMSMSLIMLIILQLRLHGFWGMFRKQTDELKRLNEELELRVKERTGALEEAKYALELRVEQRTKELKDKIDELEKFRKLSIGRELKMIELKKKIKELESNKK